ncbi:hypothetical protein L2E82_29984 [Cichorium intybus]|uniref:Uncharacterized protein n=1 Tax=Cichorium intybus TaxID=13427 RepID=A0ACB9CZ44_CICIN|nr:hypothetical protein L2E82_29984 [Cichorium intybus]
MRDAGLRRWNTFKCRRKREKISTRAADFIFARRGCGKFAKFNPCLTNLENSEEEIVDEEIEMEECPNKIIIGTDFNKIRIKSPIVDNTSKVTAEPSSSDYHSEFPKVAYAFSAEEQDDEWLIDSACSMHMTGRFEFLRDYHEVSSRGYATFRNDANGTIKGYGVLTNANFTIQRVAYVLGLKHNLVSKKKAHKSITDSSISHPLELLHIDLCGPSVVASLNHKKYILVIVDDFTRFTWVFFLRLKSDTFLELRNFIVSIELKVQLPVRRIRSDNGTEFNNRQVEEFLASKGIEHNFSAPYTP